MGAAPERKTLAERTVSPRTLFEELAAEAGRQVVAVVEAEQIESVVREQRRGTRDRVDAVDVDQQAEYAG